MISFPERVTICRLSLSANVSRNKVCVEASGWARTRIGVGWRMIRLAPYEGGEPREGRVLARWGLVVEETLEGGLWFTKPLHHAIHTAAPGDYVIPDEPGSYEGGW